MSKLQVTSSPHAKGARTTQGIMADVLIALAPAVVASVVFFGYKSLLLVAFCALSCVLLEYICRRVMKRTNTVSDLSAAVTGVLLALTLPPDIPLHLTLVGSVTAIVVVKQMFGGLGNNFVNPALVGRIVMLVSFAGVENASGVNVGMTGFRDTVFHDAVTGATPLSSLYTGEISYLDLFVGNVGGSIGETCKIAILIGFAYLLVRRVITPIIPVCYVATSALFALAVGEDVLLTILGGGLLFGAVFMATDYVTTPVTPVGQIIFAVGCGLITVLIRFYANMDEGVSYAIVLMNIMVPLIDRVTRRVTFGKRKMRKGGNAA